MRRAFLVILCACTASQEDTAPACLAHQELGPGYEEGELAFPEDAEPTVLSLEPDRELVVTVLFSSCLSSSHELRESSCTLTSEDDRLHLESLSRWSVPLGGPSLDDCRWITATCSVPGLPEGDWELTHGDRVLAFTLPSTTDEYCL